MYTRNQEDNTCEEAVRLIILPKRTSFEKVNLELRSAADLLASTIGSLVALDRTIFSIRPGNARTHLYSLMWDEETRANVMQTDGLDTGAPPHVVSVGVDRTSPASMAEGLKVLARLVSVDGAWETKKYGYSSDPICHLRASWVREVEEALDDFLAGFSSQPSAAGGAYAVVPPSPAVPSPAPPLSAVASPVGGDVDLDNELAKAVWGAISPRIAPRTPSTPSLSSSSSPQALLSQSPSVRSLDDASLHIGGLPLRRRRGAAAKAAPKGAKGAPKGAKGAPKGAKGAPKKPPPPPPTKPAPVSKKGRFVLADPPSDMVEAPLPPPAKPAAAKRVRFPPGGSERVAGGPSRPLVPKAMKMARSRSSGK
jgi:hypothetical protein